VSRILFLCLLYLGFSRFAAAQDSAPTPSDTTPADIVSQVKGTLASRLDSALPAIRFEQWLLEQVGANAQFGWVLRYQPGKEGCPIPDIPNCVEADIMLPDARSISILVAFRAPTHRPYIYSVHVIRDKHDIAELNRLSDLTNFLRRPS
jgi:hypothetical protein